MTTTSEPRRGEQPLPAGSLAESACRSCGAAIIWITTATGRQMPVSVATIIERDGVRYGFHTL